MTELFVSSLESLTSVSPARFYSVLQKTELNPDDWIAAQQMAGIKKGLSVYLEEVARSKPNSAFIEINGIGYLPVFSEVVVQLSQPGVILGTGFGILAAHDAFRKVEKLYGLTKDGYSRIIWVGSASQAQERIQGTKK